MILGSALAALTAPEAARAQAPDSKGTVDVIEVSGLLDPIVVDFIGRSVTSAARRGRSALVIQLNSGGAVASSESLDALMFQVSHSPVPVGVWVGPGKARAAGPAVRLLRAAAVAGMAAPGTRVGGLTPEQARARKVVDSLAPTVGDFLVDLDGRELNGQVLSTAREVRRDGQRRREPAVRVTFAKLGLLEQLLHTVSSPAVAYLLLVVGLSLMVFEFFSVGIGLAGIVGAGSLVLSAYGLAALPTRPLGLALVAIGVLGFSIDVQAGTPRAWTGIGALALLGGSLQLYDGHSLRWPALAVGTGGVALLMVGGMPTMLRSRFGTPTIGRDSMIGEQGRATDRVDPEGTVEVRGAVWRARTNRATPIPAGDAVRVVSIDGLLLEVEPAEPETSE